MAVEVRRPRIWPLELRSGQVLLRPLRRGDARRWRALRNSNLAWLAPWEATHPGSERAPSFGEMVSALGREARAGRMLPFGIELDGVLVGQVTVSQIAWGSMRSGHIGYWIDRGTAGRGVVPTAVAMVTDYCFLELGLHRLEVNIRPENAASLRVVHKLGFRQEGIRHAFLHIDGAWRDHLTFALTAPEVPGGLLARWRAGQQAAAAAAAAATATATAQPALQGDHLASHAHPASHGYPPSTGHPASHGDFAPSATPPYPRADSRVSRLTGRRGPSRPQ